MASLYDRISKGTISVDEITASMQRSTSVGGKYFQSMEKQSKTLNGQISTLKDNFSQFAGVLAEDTTNAISNEFLPAINDTIQSMQEAFSEEGFEGLATAFSEGFTNILMMLVERAPEIVNVAIVMIQSFVNSIQENLPMIMNSAVQIIIYLVQGIISMLPEITKIGIDLVIYLVEALIDNIDLLIDAGINLIIALADGLIEAIPKIIDKIPIIIDKLINAIINNFPKIINAGIQIMIKLALGLIQGIPQLISKAPEIVKSLADAIGKSLSAITEAGKNLVQGLWNGINSAKDWILDKIKGFGSSVLNAIKRFFGIHSPSTVMRDQVGKFLPKGIEVGFDKELPKVYDNMQKAIDLETEKMNASVQTGNVYNKVMNTTPVQVNGTYTSTLEVNGEVLATVVNDVNDKKDLQYMF